MSITNPKIQEIWVSGTVETTDGQTTDGFLDLVSSGPRNRCPLFLSPARIQHCDCFCWNMLNWLKRKSCNMEDIRSFLAYAWMTSEDLVICVFPSYKFSWSPDLHGSASHQNLQQNWVLWLHRYYCWLNLHKCWFCLQSPGWCNSVCFVHAHSSKTGYLKHE